MSHPAPGRVSSIGNQADVGQTRQATTMLRVAAGTEPRMAVRSVRSVRSAINPSPRGGNTGGGLPRGAVARHGDRIADRADPPAGGSRRLDSDRLGDHIDRLYRGGWALTGSRAEDLVQDTYARVLARPRFLRHDDDLGYLLQTLRNTFLSTRRTAAIAELSDDFRDVLVAVDVAACHTARPPAHFGWARRRSRRDCSRPPAGRAALRPRRRRAAPRQQGRVADRAVAAPPHGLASHAGDATIANPDGGRSVCRPASSQADHRTGHGVTSPYRPAPPPPGGPRTAADEPSGSCPPVPNHEGATQ